MRRFCCLLLCLLLPALALAAPDVPYDPQTLLRYAALTPAQQALVDRLYGAAMAQEARVTFDGDAAYDDVKAAMTLLTTDFPELFQLDRAYTIGYYQSTPDVANYVLLDYTMDKAQADRLREALLGEAQALVGAGASDDDFQRELCFHDALCRRVRYSTVGADNHLATSALLSGTAACEGYSQAMTLLCRLSGIPASMVYGRGAGGEHAWNALMIGGVLCYTDVTWDDQEAITVYSNFNLSAEQMAVRHQLEETLALPWPSSDLWEYHRVMGLVATTQEEAQAIFRQGLTALVRTGQPVRIRFATQALYNDSLSTLGQQIDAYNASAAPSDCLYGAYAWLREDDGACLTVYVPEGAGDAREDGLSEKGPLP